MTFSELELKKPLQDAIKDLGFEQPTPIQEATFAHLGTSDSDIIALAATGTGKTAAFSLPILQKLDLNSEDVQAFILSPTRELALQITKDIQNFSKYMDGVRVQAVYGGASIRDQISGLKMRPQIVVGTPGRVLDLINKGKLKVHAINWLVLDEADEMLSMGFKDDLDAILSTTPDTKQTFLFSATMPNEIKHIASSYMKNPATISVGQVNTSNKNIEHLYYVVEPKNKYQALKMLVDSNPHIYGIIFCRTKIDTQEIADMLGQDGYNADAIHGDLAQGQRDFVMGRFKTGQLQLLVATDVAARGVDVSDLTHVINYTLPDDPEVYIHRTGRTGRAGKTGIALSIIIKKDLSKIKQIERQIKQPITYTLVPDGKTICASQLSSLMHKVKNTPIDEDMIAPYVPQILEAFEGLSPEEVLKKFISVEFNKFIDYYKGIRDINVDITNTMRSTRDGGRDGGRDNGRSRDSNFGRDRSNGSDRGERSFDRAGSSDGQGYTTLRMNHGRKSGINPKSLLGFINDITPDKKISVGNIKIDVTDSLFEVRNDQVDILINSLQQSGHSGVKFSVSEQAKTTRNESRRPSSNQDFRGEGGHKKDIKRVTKRRK
jgi:ATP-dependent RNA helicase DeaD